MGPTRFAAIALAALALTAAARADTGTPTSEPDDMVMGSAKAPVTVIEYASASCPHCARFNNDVFPALKTKYVDAGKVRWVFREFLTPPPELAAAVFMTARCVGPAHYFAVIDAAFHAQEKIYSTGDLMTPLRKIATDNGLDDKAFQACLGDQKGFDALNARVERYATRDQIRSTPTFLIGGARLEGEQTLQALETAIAKAHGPT
jgi:protein-disulfide isomerase